MPDLAQTALDRLRQHLPTLADPVRAVAMAAYMRDQFPFLGLPSPQLKQVTRHALAGLAKPDEAALREFALGCWELPEREYQYVACGWLRRYAGVCGPDFLATAEQLIVTKSWWDTVDTLAAHLVGPLVRRHPQLLADMDSWVAGDQLWLARAAILHQLTYKSETDADRLFRYCAQRASHPDFFIRKAIGWALREYAWTDPAAVKRFVSAHDTVLSGLSKREALKNQV